MEAYIDGRQRTVWSMRLKSHPAVSDVVPEFSELSELYADVTRKSRLNLGHCESNCQIGDRSGRTPWRSSKG